MQGGMFTWSNIKKNPLLKNLIEFLYLKSGEIFFPSYGLQVTKRDIRS